MCIYILSVNNDIRGIKVDNEEIEVSLFADDPTGFLKDDLSQTNFLKLIEDYGTCSGLKVNHEKTEPLLLGNLACSVQETALNNIKIKRSAKILGVHFAYDIRAKQKLNINELISSIQLKLRVWRWRDLTVIGRIQIVKPFIIPIFLYRTSLISLDKEFVKQADKIIFDFIWKE